MNEPRSGPGVPRAEDFRGPGSLSRRRLIRAGASTVPIVATLASRPVLGSTCRTTSAWGSTQLMAQQSHTHAGFTITTYSLLSWSENDGTPSLTSPWTFMRSAGNSFGFGDAKTLRNGLTVGQLFGSVPFGWDTLTGGSVHALLRDTGNVRATSFQKAILVAMLNLMTSTPGNPVGSCVTVADLRDMGDGSFQPPNLGVPWGQPEIRNYLTANGLLGPLA